jgi:hypothetical protein
VVRDLDSAPTLIDAAPAPIAADFGRRPVVLRVRARPRSTTPPLAMAAALALVTFWIVVAATFRASNELPTAQVAAANGAPLMVTPVSLPVASRSAVVTASDGDAGLGQHREASAP